VKTALRWGGVAALVVACALAVAVVHVTHRGESSIAASEKALAAGDVAGAIAWARDAAMSRAPGSPYPAAAYARLEGIAAHAEEHGDFDHATMAWRAIWTAVHATRSEELEQARLDDAARALVRLAAKTCEGNQSRPPATCAAAAKASLIETSLPALPRFHWLALGAVGFFVGGATAARGRGMGRQRFLSLAVAVVGVGLAALALVTR